MSVGQTEAQAADQLQRPRRDHRVLRGDVDVSEHPLQRAVVVDRRSAARAVAAVDRARGGAGGVGGGEAQQPALLVGDRVAGRHGSPCVAHGLGDERFGGAHVALPPAATSAWIGARSASGRLLPCGRLSAARTTSSSIARRARPSATDATPRASIPKNENR